MTEHEGMKQWLSAVDDRREVRRDAELNRDTVHAQKIRHLIELVEREVKMARDEMQKLAAHGDPNWRALEVAGDLAASKVNGLRSALQIITGTKN